MASLASVLINAFVCPSPPQLSAPGTGPTAENSTSSHREPANNVPHALTFSSVLSLVVRDFVGGTAAAKKPQLPGKQPAAKAPLDPQTKLQANPAHHVAPVPLEPTVGAERSVPGIVQLLPGKPAASASKPSPKGVGNATYADAQRGIHVHEQHARFIAETSVSALLSTSEQAIANTPFATSAELKHLHPDAAPITKGPSAIPDSSRAVASAKPPPVLHANALSNVSARPEVLLAGVAKQPFQGTDHTKPLGSEIVTSPAAKTPEAVRIPSTVKGTEADVRSDQTSTGSPADSRNESSAATAPTAPLHVEVRKAAEPALLPQFRQMPDAAQSLGGFGELAKATQADNSLLPKANSEGSSPIPDHEHDHLPKITIENNDEAPSTHLRLPAVLIEARGEASRQGEEPAVAQRRVPDPFSVELRTSGPSQPDESTRESSLHVRLAAPELGDVQIHLTGSLHTVSAKLVVNQEMTGQLLENHAASLRQRLADSGIQLGGYEVFRRSTGGGEQQHKQDDSQSGLKQPTDVIDSIKSLTSTRRIAASIRLGTINVLA